MDKRFHSLQFTSSQRKLFAQFLSNMAVVWFTSAFIAPTTQFTLIKSLINGFSALVISIIIIKEVD